MAAMTGYVSTCQKCGERIGCPAVKTETRKEPDGSYVFVTILDSLDLSAHMLMHQQCTCDWQVTRNGSNRVIAGRRTDTNLDCPIHGRNP